MKVAEYIERVKEHYGWDSDAEQEWREIQTAIKLKELTTERAKEFLQLSNSNVISGERIEECKKSFNVLDKLLEDSEK